MSSISEGEFFLPLCGYCETYGTSYRDMIWHGLQFYFDNARTIRFSTPTTGLGLRQLDAFVREHKIYCTARKHHIAHVAWVADDCMLLEELINKDLENAAK